MEIGFNVDLFTTTSRTVMAFVLPLVFLAILQNLFVKVDDVEKSVNLGEVFDKFKFRIKEVLIRRDIIDRVMRQRRFLDAKNVSNETLLETCRFYAKDDSEFDELLKRINGMTDEAKRIEYIVWFVDRAGTVDIAGELIKESLNGTKT